MVSMKISINLIDTLVLAEIKLSFKNRLKNKIKYFLLDSLSLFSFFIKMILKK